MEGETGIPVGIVIAFGFLMVMIALATINFRLSAQKKQFERERNRRLEEGRADQQVAQVQGYASGLREYGRQRAIAEAIRRDPTLEGASSPDELQRLDDAAETIRREWQVKAELNAVKAEQERSQKEAEQRLAKQREEEQAAAQLHAARKVREERLARMSPLRRCLTHHLGATAFVASLVVVGAALLGMQWWSNQREARIAAERVQLAEQQARARQDADRERRRELEAETSLNRLCSATAVQDHTEDTDLLKAWLECKDDEVVREVLEVESFTQLSGVDLKGRDLRDLDLSAKNFSNANLVNADLRNTNLTSTTFRKAALTGAKFGNADLRGADFTQANLQLANFFDARIRNATWDQARVLSTVWVDGDRVGCVKCTLDASGNVVTN